MSIGMPTYVIPFTVGRMGNYLFQVAATIGYAKRHGLEFTVPAHPYQPRRDPVYLGHLVHPKFDAMMPSMTVKEQFFHYHEIPFQEEWKDGRTIILEGYWQSEKYFKEFRADILKLFGFEWTSMPGTVSVHVRRGDYLKWRQKHPPVGAEWMEKAMEQFPGHRFIFFSDDIGWCRKVFGKRKDCSFSMGHDEVRDLVEMSWCEHQICSASTYSWWGAWLNQNPNKRVVIPRLWFVPGWGGHNTKDVVPEGWIRMNNGGA